MTKPWSRTISQIDRSAVGLHWQGYSGIQPAVEYMYQNDPRPWNTPWHGPQTGYRSLRSQRLAVVGGVGLGAQPCCEDAWSGHLQARDANRGVGPPQCLYEKGRGQCTQSVVSQVCGEGREGGAYRQTVVPLRLVVHMARLRGIQSFAAVQPRHGFLRDGWRGFESHALVRPPRCAWEVPCTAGRLADQERQAIGVFVTDIPSRHLTGRVCRGWRHARRWDRRRANRWWRGARR